MAAEPRPEHLRVPDTAIAILEVGVDRVAFAVHANLICNVSTFFSAVLQGLFGEGELEIVVPLPEDVPETFEMFRQWLYSQQYAGMAAEKLRDSESATAEIKRFLDLYVFADKISATKLTHQMLKKHYHYTQIPGGYFSVPCMFLVEQLYHRTTPACPLRRLWVAMHVWINNFGQTEIDGGFPNYRYVAFRCPELAADLISELLGRVTGSKSNPFDVRGPGMVITTQLRLTYYANAALRQ